MVRTREGKPVGEMLTWGFRPHWMQQKSKNQINARAETLFDTRMFASAARWQRCLVIADGFYEPAGKTQPRPWYRFHFDDEHQFTMAGIWTSWGRAAERHESFAIVTTAADSVVCRIHERMPLLIDESNRAAWLDPRTPREDVDALCVSQAASGLRCDRVSDYVKNPRNEGPACIAPVEDPGPLQRDWPHC